MLVRGVRRGRGGGDQRVESRQGHSAPDETGPNIPFHSYLSNPCPMQKRRELEIEICVCHPGNYPLTCFLISDRLA